MTVATNYKSMARSDRPSAVRSKSAMYRLMQSLDLSFPSGESWSGRMQAATDAAQRQRARIAELELENFKLNQRVESLEEELRAAEARERFATERLRITAESTPKPPN